MTNSIPEVLKYPLIQGYKNGAGETTVALRGDGLRGRNMGMTLSCKVELENIDGILFFPGGTKKAELKRWRTEHFGISICRWPYSEPLCKGHGKMAGTAKSCVKGHLGDVHAVFSQ